MLFTETNDLAMILFAQHRLLIALRKQVGPDSEGNGASEARGELAWQ